MDIGEIQDVTDSLALMPDAALQKYAMMNKDDPYVMSLAMSENNRRKKIRAAQQGQAGQMPKPKVVDQAIQSINPPPAPPPQAMPPQGAPQQPQPMPPQGMPQAQQQLPEDQGIAQLPAPNMQGMADGGIVGYAVGGVPTPAAFGEFLRTQGVNPPDFSRLPSAAQETLKRLFSNATAGPQMATATPTPIPPTPAVAAAAAEQPGLPYRMGQSLAQGAKRVGDFISRGSPKLGVGLAALLTPSNEGQDTRQDEMLAAVRGEGYKGKPYNKEAAAALLKEMGLDPARVPDKAAPAVKPAALPPTGADQGRGGRGGPSEKELIAAGKARDGADAAKTDLGLQSLLRTDTSTSQAEAPETDPTKIAAEYAKVRDAYTPQNRFGKEIGELTAAEAAMHAQNKAQLLADIEKRGPAMAGYETRLKGREERLSKQEADLSGMSIMEAGLAMMAGTSPHALTNIGAGAQSGVKSYKAGLEKLAEARDKLDDSFSRIEELRRSEGTANDKEIRQAGKDIAQTAVEAKKLTLSALMKDGELGRKEAETAFTTMAANRKAIYEQEQQTKRSGMEQAGANARAMFSAQTQKDIAAMPPAEARMLMQLGGGDLKKGMEIQQSISAGKFNPMTSYADYLKGFAGKETVTPPMSYVDYVAQFQGPKLVNVAPASLKP